MSPRAEEEAVLSSRPEVVDIGAAEPREVARNGAAMGMGMGMGMGMVGLAAQLNGQTRQTASSM
jgi:hypothetical protein